GAAFAVVIIALFIAAQQVRLHARDWVDDWLTNRYQSDVELSSFRISVYPNIQAVGENLVLHFHGRMDLPPLIAVKRFSLHATIAGLFANGHVRLVHLEGLQLNIPPRGESGPGGRSGMKQALRRFRNARFDEILSED